MSKYTKCIHDTNATKHSIVIDPNTFIPFCAVCKEKLENLIKVDPAIEAYNRAMSIIKQ